MMDTQECGCRYVGLFCTVPFVIVLLIAPWFVKYVAWVLK